METHFTFEDVLIKPKFSTIASRKDVDLSVKELGLRLPVISSNMETITGPKMAQTMHSMGAIGAIHRFCNIEENIKMFKESECAPIVSIGIGDKEFERAEALIAAGAYKICIDVAHGAQMSVKQQLNNLRTKYQDNICIIVGNFATLESLQDFNLGLSGYKQANFYKIGIGPGSVCTTRLKTGVGVPQLSAIMECAADYPIIADGGINSPGDIAKALGAGAKAVMIGQMFAGTDETPGEIEDNGLYFKKYKGSASHNYASGQKTSEGIETLVPYKGPVSEVLKDIEGGLRSALTYTGSRNLEEFRSNCEFVRVSSNTIKENGTRI